MLKEHAEEINATEMMFQVEWFKKSYHCVVLATVKDGYSFKPFFPDDGGKEKKDLINEYVGKYNTYKEAKAIIENPTYCFLHSKPYASIEEIRQIVKDGNTKSVALGRSSNPVCPFA